MDDFDRKLYEELYSMDNWSYKGYQCRIVDVDSDPGECYKTAAFVVTPNGALERVPITTYNSGRELIELWIDAGCPMNERRYSDNDLKKIKAERESYSSNKTYTAKQIESEDPCIVLGVSTGATIDEITIAYRRLAAQYHPDKVASLAVEFRELAERRMKAINAAYEKLKRRF